MVAVALAVAVVSWNGWQVAEDWERGASELRGELRPN